MVGLLKRKKKKHYEIASGVVNGKEVTYSFTRPVPEDRAMHEFRKAVEQGLPSGSIIVVG